MSKVYIIMGVSGCGKSTIGNALAKKLEIPFFDGDDFHSQENIIKMKSGLPLNDIDRQPWLKSLRKLIEENSQVGTVIACSALKNDYRKVLIANENVFFVYLKASKILIKKRLAARKDHFMPDSLIQSQFEALEEPENAIVIDAQLDPKTVIDLIVK